MVASMKVMPTTHHCMQAPVGKERRKSTRWERAESSTGDAQSSVTAPRSKGNTIILAPRSRVSLKRACTA